MFHTLRKICIVLIFLFVCGLVISVGAFVYEKRAIFDPVADLIEVLKIPGEAKPLEVISGQVIKVLDDYSIKLKDDRGLIYNLRLVGLETLPRELESAKPAAGITEDIESKLTSLVLSNRVRVEVSFMNAQHAGHGLVYAGETNVNAVLVEAGLAKIKREYLQGLPRQAQFALVRAESKAQQQQLGLWRTAPEPKESLAR